MSNKYVLGIDIGDSQWQLKKQGKLLPIFVSMLNEHAALAGAASCWQNK